MTSTKATQSAASKLVKRPWQVGIAASLLLSASPVALHAEVSNSELAKEIAELKAQIRSLKGGVSEAKKEARHASRTTKVVAAPVPVAPPPAFAAIPAGATPVFVTADKKMQFGALTITPGGFIAAESVYRSRAQQADIASFNQVTPFGPQAGLNEFRFTARQSRAALLVEAPISQSTLVSAYGEFDFLGAGITSNYNESNSYIPRIRNLYAQLDNADYGMHLLAGQNWSLATMNSKGITPRNEVTPPTIDGQFVQGFVWKRQPQIRLTKDFDKKLWLSISAEMPGTTISNCTNSTNGGAYGTTAVTGINGNVTCTINGVNQLGSGTYPIPVATTHVPDVIGKAAYEARIADRDVHLEAFGIYRDFYDRVSYAGTNFTTNHNSTGYGVGGGLIAPLLPRRLDFQVSGLYGRGVGSYGTSQFSDSVLRADGSESPIREQMLLAGVIGHVTPSIDIYAFAGVEQVQAQYSNGEGYGLPTANNSSCFDDNNLFAATTCAANTKRVWQITGGMWDKLYKGQFGEVRAGIQYEYAQRELFQGSGGGAAALNFSPHQNDNIVLTSFRYYPFQ